MVRERKGQKQEHKAPSGNQRTDSWKRSDVRNVKVFQKVLRGNKNIANKEQPELWQKDTKRTRCIKSPERT